MKRVICLVVAIVLSLCATTAFAEKYTLHSGVEFGMPADEVIAKQKERGNTFQMEGDRLKNTNKITILDLDASIFYDFDRDGHLTRQQYYFRDVNFAPLKDEFEKVYGSHNCSSISGSKLVLPANSFSGPLPSAKEMVSKVLGSGIADKSYVKSEASDLIYYQWLIEVDEGYVVIEEYGYEYYVKIDKNPKQLIATVCLVDYRLFSKEDIEGAQNENAQKYNDI